MLKLMGKTILTLLLSKVLFDIELSIFHRKRDYDRFIIIKKFAESHF